ncbi:hypothetical protein BASA50_006928 [Batrachochytrium salamandrivorans]|uniref:Uncharacterized protein n=1 Tax=Batrachochytrium salamandrivorans TaxID=1357716 RepID=A0ABQ8FBK0_9FUNG|nr:hypothetical protein BASA50_006928 [Batrachochytrium salamandrivorans]
MRVSAAIAVLAITAPLTSVVFAHPNPLPAVVDGALANTNFLADMPPIQKRSQESTISISDKWELCDMMLWVQDSAQQCIVICDGAV